jgi:hypothetical protein
MENIVLSQKNNNRQDLKKFLKNICVIDTNYRNKHKKLIDIYNEYNDIYNEPEVQNNIKNDIDYKIAVKKEIEEPMNVIYLMLKNNGEEIYKNRLNIINLIKEDTSLTDSDKSNISNYLIEMYNSDTNNMKCCLEPIYKSSEFIFHDNINSEKDNDINKNYRDGINVQTLDKAYLKKHNELVQLFKAYQVLFQKVGDYKKKLDKYQKMATSPLISKDKMKKLLDDQKFIMNSVDEMQKELVNMNVIKPEERVPTNLVVNQTTNMDMFNNEMKKQINNILISNNAKKNNIKTVENNTQEIRNRVLNILKQKLNDKSISYIVR